MGVGGDVGAQGDADGGGVGDCAGVLAEGGVGWVFYGGGYLGVLGAGG